MKSRVKRRKVKYSDARNMRKVSYKYIPVDDDHAIAVAGGRCHKCWKITVDICFACGKYVCPNHSQKAGEEILCKDCLNSHTKARPDYIG